MKIKNQFSSISMIEFWMVSGVNIVQMKWRKKKSLNQNKSIKNQKDWKVGQNFKMKYIALTS